MRNRWTDRRWVCKHSAVYSESESSSELKHVCILHFYYTASVSILILKLAYVCSVSYGNASFRLFRFVTNDCTARNHEITIRFRKKKNLGYFYWKTYKIFNVWWFRTYLTTYTAKKKTTKYAIFHTSWAVMANPLKNHCALEHRQLETDMYATHLL